MTVDQIIEEQRQKEDLTGRERLVKNVSTSYLSHAVFMIFGFILPRVISDHVGQVGLGIWDFSWSFVNYLSLSMIGIGSSVNRFVARYRATGDTLSLNKIVSTVVAVQLVIALFVFIAAIALAYAIPNFFSARLGSDAELAGWVVGLLGGALAVQMAFDAWRGVLSGCHRWDYYNTLNAGSYAVISLCMLTALYAGQGLIAMATIYFVGTILTELLRYKIARTICPEISLKRSYINRDDARKVIKFGAKTILLALPSMVTVQTVFILIVAQMGPASLAIIARPLALVRTVSVLVGKYTSVLVPTAGSLQSQGKFEELRAFALQSSRNGWLIAIPPLTFLFVLGDRVVDIWMGPDYAYWAISAILAGGFLLPISQGALLRILIGLDAHGGIAKISAIATLGAVIIALAMTVFTGWSLPIAAALIAVPIGIGVGLTILIYGFRHLKIGFGEYFRAVLFDGIVLLAVTCGALLALRMFSPFSSLVTVALGIVVTGIVFAVLHSDDVRELYREIRK